MKQNIGTARIVLDSRRKTVQEKFPIKLVIIFKRQRKYYGTGFSLSKNDWNSIQKTKVRGELRKTDLALSQVQVNAQNACNQLSANFTFTKFENAFFVKPEIVSSSEIYLQSLFQKYILKLDSNDQIRTAYPYNCACVSLNKFKPKLKLDQITPDFLRAYEGWFINQGKSITTVGIYLRSLRCIFNIAVEDGLIDVN